MSATEPHGTGGLRACLAVTAAIVVTTAVTVLGGKHFIGDGSVAPSMARAGGRARANTKTTAGHAAYSEAVYQHQVLMRKAAFLKHFQGDPDKVIPFDAPREIYLWDFFAPNFNCPYRERLGRFSEGGKVVCNWQALKHRRAPGRVISIGVRGDVSFEVELMAKTGATIHAYDPTVDELAVGGEGKGQRMEGPGGQGEMIFHKVGLKGGSMNPKYTAKNTYMSMKSIMEDVKFERIDLLKIDCEGCEWDAFADMAKSGVLNKLDQFQIELHFKQSRDNKNGPQSGVRQVFEFFQAVEAAGLRPFSWEVNLNTAYFNMKPWAIEYSFVRNDSDYITVPPYSN